MKELLVLLFLLPLAALAQHDSIVSGAYEWQQPVMQKNKIVSTVLVKGKAHDFEWMELSANTISGKTEITPTFPSRLEHVILIKSGSVTIQFRDASFLLTQNSVAVLMRGESYSLKNLANEPCDYYTMKYYGKNVIDEKKIPAARSFVKLWEEAPFKPNTIGGGRRDFFECPTAMQKRFEIHVTTLKEGIRSHEPHTHKAEEIVLLISGDTEMQIGDQFKKVKAGGFYYLGSNVLHAIKNTGTMPATYFAIQFE